MTLIIGIRISKLWETCDRTSFYVTLESDEGFDKQVECHRTNSIMDREAGHPGISIDEARDRALIDVHRWADFLNLELDPYIEDSVLYEPSMRMLPHTVQRELAKRRAAKAFQIGESIDAE